MPAAAPIASDSAAVAAHSPSVTPARVRRPATNHVGVPTARVLGLDPTHLAVGHRPVLEREEARGLVARRPLDERWVALRARLLRARAARMEAAAGRRVDRVRHVAAEDERAPLPPDAAGSRPERRRGARRCTGAAGLRTGRATWRAPRPAEVHHGDAVGDVPDDAEIMGDEDVRQPELPLQVACSRLRICACTETSSAETGSSATISLGLTASARAIPMRWR